MVDALTNRFWDKVAPEPMTGCWLWIGSSNGAGYGELRVGGVKFYAHRLAYQAANGPIPAGLQIDHLCRQRCCVNPDHLEAVTPSENSRRGLTGKHGNQKRRTRCPSGHEYTEDNTYNFKHGRRCRACAQARSRANYHRATRGER